MDQELLIRYLRGDSNEEEQLAVVDWIDEDPGHFIELQTLRRLYDLQIWQEEEAKPKTLTISTNNFHRKIRQIGYELAKIAAVFAVALLTYFALFNKKNEASEIVMQKLYVPAGQRAELTLSDGSKVWLNANTTFIFPNRFTGETRMVTLNGEGYFDVTKNKQNPFIVQTDRFNVKAWGTSFNLLAYSGSHLFETSLLEGSVEILKPESDKGIYLKPDDRVSLENDQLVLTKIQHYNYFLWKDGLISFDNESFPEMVKKLELYFDLKIEVKNASINRYHCTGKFRTKDGIEHILKVLQLSNQFNFKIDEKLNIITID